MTSEKQRAWDATYLEMARLASQHSHDPRLKVGAVVVDQENGSVIAIGINGRGRGRPNEPLSLEPGQSGCAHAEMNALARASWQGGKTYTLYVTHSPCPVCAALILNVPVTRVVYGEGYRDPVGVNELVEGGLDVSQLPLVGHAQ